MKLIERMDGFIPSIVDLALITLFDFIFFL